MTSAGSPAPATPKTLSTSDNAHVSDLGHGQARVTFRVDDVTPAAQPLPTRPLHEWYPQALAIGGDTGMPVVEPDGVHPLLSAVGTAFAQHRSLVLSPDAVWLTITAGVAQHVRLHAEQLRPQLVGHAGREPLMLAVHRYQPDDPACWRDIVDGMHRQLTAQITDPEVFACDFSTSTAVERVAGQVVLLDAYAPYYSCWLTCVCGIPSITLTGTVEDWRTIRARVDAIEKFGLRQWRRSLVPIADQFVRAAGGDVDIAFWQRIYNPVDAYGGNQITGWVGRFYPYLQANGGLDFPNPLLHLPIDQPRDVTKPAIRSTMVPATLSKVVINVCDLATGARHAMAVHAGLVGVAQNSDGALRPVVGWHVTPAAVEIDDLIDRIIAEHDTRPPRQTRPLSGPAELQALYRRLSAASLFAGAWRMLPAGKNRRIWRGRGHLPLCPLVELADGRTLCAAEDSHTGTAHWILARIDTDRLLDDPADVPVFGTSLAMLLDAALDTGGTIAGLQTGCLADLDR